MSNVIGRTISEQMREESKYLRCHLQAREAIKEIVEMPDQQADRLLRSLEQNKGELAMYWQRRCQFLQSRESGRPLLMVVAKAMQEEEPIDITPISQ